MAAKKRATRAPQAEKRCARCKKTKPRSDFPRNKTLADGLGAYCRACKRDADREQHRPTRERKTQSSSIAVKDETPEILAAPEARKGGRPSSITPELIAAICRPLRKGHSRRVASRVAGINEDTLATWMLRGREAKEPTAPTRQLYDAVLEAEGEGLMTLEQKAIDGAEIDHVQALRLLERRDPESWARREPKPADSDSKHMEVDDVRRLLTERLTKFLESPPSAAPSPGAADAGATSGAGGGAA